MDLLGVPIASAGESQRFLSFECRGALAVGEIDALAVGEIDEPFELLLIGHMNPLAQVTKSLARLEAPPLPGDGFGAFQLQCEACQ